MSKRAIDIHMYRFGKQCQNLKEQIDSLESLVDGRVKQLRKTLDALTTLEEQIGDALETYKEATEREAKRPIRELERKLESLEKKIESNKSVATVDTYEGLDKAKTLSIFDSILFAISNWADDGDTAPDIELACKSVLFPTVYERVMSGNQDYALETVPVAALEIVNRGREFIRSIRMRTTDSLIRQDVWDQYAPEVQKWWISDALPLIYGARDPDWDEDQPLTLVEVTEWQEHPASRALHFPLIFDGMELVNRYRDEIRSSTGLPEFNRTILDTRLKNVHE